MAEALKDAIDQDFIDELATALSREVAAFDRRSFRAKVSADLDRLSITERWVRVAEACRAALPAPFESSARLLIELAPSYEGSVAGFFIPEFIGRYGRDQPDLTFELLRCVTRYASAEFAVRPYLRDDFERTLAIMTTWADDSDHHVRRLASEGTRPRLPWSFHLERLIADPAPTRPILEELKGDPEVYVRRSVANHLNDIGKDHPQWMLNLLSGWDLDDPRLAWTAEHAARSLIKRGEPQALALFGLASKPAVRIERFQLTPRSLKPDDKVVLQGTLKSDSRKRQRLAVGYAVHYRTASGRPSRKVFKIKQIELAPGASAKIEKAHAFRQLATRRLFPGRHKIEILVNGEALAGGEVTLQTS